MQTIRFLAVYNERTNGLMNGIIQGLSPEEWDRNLGGYFTSVHELCSHMYISDYNWLKRLKRLRPFRTGSGDELGEKYRFGETVFSSIDEYLEKRKSLDSLFTAFIHEVEEGDFDMKLRYVDSAGNRYERVFGGLLLHVFNHQTHHRGMISVYLEMLGRGNDFSNLNELL